MPDDVEIVVSAQNHEYRKATAQIGYGLFDAGTITEDFGEEETPESEYGERKQVIIIL